MLGTPSLWESHDQVGRPIGGAAKEIAAIRRLDKTLHLFYVGLDGCIYHGYLSEGNVHHGDNPTGASEAKELQAILRSDGTIHLFYVGGNDGNWHGYLDAEALDLKDHYHGDSDTGASDAHKLNAILRADGTIHLFYIGGNGGNWHGYLDAGALNLEGHYHGDSETGASGAKNLRACLSADGRIHLFYIGGDRGVWHGYLDAQAMALTDGYHGDEELVPEPTIDICVISGSDGKPHLFSMDLKGRTTHRWPNQNETTWQTEIVDHYRLCDMCHGTGIINSQNGPPNYDYTSQQCPVCFGGGLEIMV